MRILPLTIRPQSFGTTLPHWRGHLALASSVAAGAWAVIFIRLAQEEGIPSVYVGAFRLTLAALILTPFVLRKYRSEISHLSRRDWLHIVAAGFVLAVLFAAASFALEHTTVLIAAMLFAINPLWIALLERFLLKTPMRRGLWVGLAITIVGSIIIAVSGASDFNLGHNPVLGAGLALVGSLGVALYAIVGREVRHHIPLAPYMYLVFVTGAAIAILFVLASGTPLVGYSIEGYVWLALITLIPHLVNHMAYNYALRHLPATYCSIFGQIEVILSVTIAFLLFREVPGILQLPGSIAVLLGVTLVSLSQPQAD
jgi:drug/metabolite transporter (DMT)-like permease